MVPAPKLSPIRESGGPHMPALYDALSMAQGEFKPIEKKRVGKVEGESRRTGKAYNYTYKYADLSDVFAAVRPALSAHGLAIMQITRLEGGSMIVTTRLTHRSGSWIEGDYPVAAVSGGIQHQTIGGALTYAKRNSACAIIGVVGEDDLDGDGEDREGMPDGGAVEFNTPEKAKAAPPRRQEAPKQDAPRQQSAEQQKPKAAAAAFDASDPFIKQMMEQSTAVDLTKWHTANAAEIQKRSAQSEDWRNEFYARYDARQLELKGGKR